jgi:hypothetical protein
MKESTKKALEKVIKFGAAFGELSPPIGPADGPLDVLCTHEATHTNVENVHTILVEHLQ